MAEETKKIGTSVLRAVFPAWFLKKKIDKAQEDFIERHNQNHKAAGYHSKSEMKRVEHQVVGRTKKVSFWYKNHRGETSLRRVVPNRIEFNTSEWHPDRQWILVAWCLDRKEFRNFAIRDIKDWSAMAVPNG